MNMILIIASLLYFVSFGISEKIMVSFNISPVIKDVKIPVDINLDEGAALKTVVSEPVDPFASSPVQNINIDPGKILLSVLVTAGAIKEATIDVGNSSETYYTLPLCFDDKPSELSSLEYVRVTSSSDFMSDKVIVFSWAKFNCSKDLTGIDSSTTSKQINEESGSNTGIIVGVMASGIALLIIVVIISYTSYRNKRNIARDGNEMEIGMGPSSTDINKSIKFVAASGGSVPHNAFPGGQDRSGEILYIGRAMHEGSKIPGKLHPSHGVLYVAWGGREHKKTHYDVLVQGGSEDNLIWINVTETSVMVSMGAIQGGYEADGSPLYIGRAKIDGKWTVGKVSPKYSFCYVPHGGKEHEEIQYQVLCAKGPSDNEPVEEAGVAGGGIPNWVTGLALGVPVAAALAYDLFGPGGDDEIKENPVKATEISEKLEKRERR